MVRAETGDLAEVITASVEGLGFELVTVERGGGKRRPLFRIRIDRPDSEPGRSSVTVENCAAVSRAVNETLETHPEAPDDFIVEVSSPGVDRPLVKPRDYDRFAGQSVSVRGTGALHEGRRRIEGVLLGRTDDGRSVTVEVAGERLDIPLAAIAKARLVFRWDDGRR
jgi:ribosome maturation factor RimP